MTRTIRPINYLAYGANDLLGAGAMAVLSGWILYFYTTFCGLSAVQTTSIFAVARVLLADLHRERQVPARLVGTFGRQPVPGVAGQVGQSRQRTLGQVAGEP